MTKTMRSFLGLALPVFAALCAGDAAADGGPVTIFDRPPSVQELRSVVRPDRPILTRGIEILGKAVGAAQQAAPARQSVPAAYVPQEPEVQPQAPRPPAPTAAAMPQPGPQPEPRPEPRPESRPTATPEATPTPAGIFGFRINFAFNSAVIPSEFYPFMDSVGELMAQEPELALLIEGHTDAVGSDAYNQALSALRAQAAQAYLVTVHGVAPERLVVRGRGEAEPIQSDPHDGKNRRVEFERVR
ncbi:OmpA family protein [Arenibaculum sp.]|jgi:outer membrane protein OmpA-like peptidoglycan-associated protein|uniref:OmpA family protein n=1 Tax=Arenibaculum sp. TaxID=2865862 RepID=UPI002E1195CF|nr:OmpA family protein [Arenibaculum sp.]